VHDLDLRFPDIIGETKLTENASKMIETSLDRIPADRHFGPQRCEQRAVMPETGDLHIKSGSIQPVCDMNELTLGAADTEVVQKL
jgi:hypothetical protein